MYEFLQATFAVVALALLAAMIPGTPTARCLHVGLVAFLIGILVLFSL